MRYLYKRGGAGKRVMHLGGYDPMSGEPNMQPICGRASVRVDTSCNLPLGRPTCKWCLARYAEMAAAS